MIEHLEPRIAPAAISLTFVDGDGDIAKITASKAVGTPSLDASDLTFIGGGTAGQLAMLDLTEPGFAGASITIAIVKQVGIGDGRVHVGKIEAGGRDLGTVIVRGDLGQIDAGDSNLATPGLKKLSALSIGRYGLATQGGTGDLFSGIYGGLGTLVLEGVVFLGSGDGHLYALDAATGAEKWRYKTDDKILGGANYAKAPTGAGHWILVGSYDSSLHCVDAANGKVVWTHATDNYINGTPVVTPDGEIIFGGCDSFIHVLAVKDGKEIRQIESEAYIASSVATADGLGYVGNYGNIVLGFNPKDGAILWKYRDRNFPYFSSAAVTEDRVIIGGRDKRLHCIDRATGKGVWTFQTRGEVESSPVVCGEVIVVGSADGRLYGVALANGQERWAYEIGAPVTASPAVADGRIVVGAEDGVVYCFAAKP